MKEIRYECRNCFLIFPQEELVDDSCPSCGISIKKGMIHIRCEKDHLCICKEDVTAGLQHCGVCGKPTCKCGSHNVMQNSRVTGYLSDVAGYNSGKRAELRDRVRYNDIT